MESTSEIGASEVLRSLKRFSDYAGDLLGANSSNFADRVQLLMSFCRKDSIFSIIDGQLRDRQTSEFDEWLAQRASTRKGMVGSGELTFPTDLDTRVSTMYWLLQKVYFNELDVVKFAHDFHATKNHNRSEYTRFFTDTIVAPLKRELENRFDDLIDELNSKSKVTIEDLKIFESVTIDHKDIPSNRPANHATVGPSDNSMSGVNINLSLRYSALSVVESAQEYRESVRGNNRLAADFPEERKKLLAFLKFVEEAARELTEIVPEDEYSVPPSEDMKIQSWMERFSCKLQSDFKDVMSPECVSGLVVPSTLVFGLGTIGGIVGGVPGFAVGSLVGQFVAGHVKAGKLADGLVKESADD